MGRHSAPAIPVTNRLAGWLTRRARRRPAFVAALLIFLTVLTATVPANAAATAHTPFGALDTATFTAGAVTVAGWAIDPDTTAPITVTITIDSHQAATITAAGYRPDVARYYRHYGARHGYTTRIGIPDGVHTICVTAINTGAGANTRLGCRPVTGRNSPVGALTAVTRTAGATAHLTGWALDPNTAGPITVRVTVNGAPATTGTAGTPTTVPAAWAGYGAAHGYTLTATIPLTSSIVCATGVNVGAGADRILGCVTLPAATPSAPRTVTATATTTTVTLAWTAPATDAGVRITSYRITAAGNPRATAVPAPTTRATIAGLTAAHRYTYTVTALNAAGASTGTSITVTTATLPPPVIPAQTTPAPVSTSHYPRNWTGNPTIDTALMRQVGATDARYNPTGHRYLVLLDLGGQTGGGIMLSATSKFIGYPDAVRAVEAYLDGYVSRQRPDAPLQLALGTNNDINVDAVDGAIWARAVVNPVRAYAARHRTITVSGADDMEPGFSATARQTRTWLSGYLAATTAGFVFNGSADGCSPHAAAGRCNNGWTQADLQWLAGGAAPGRISVLPQIYNGTMSWQWRNISLTGLGARRPRLSFAGPLTEWTACRQSPCYSLPNVTAWSDLWAALNSSPATRQPQLPYGTDLRID